MGLIKVSEDRSVSSLLPARKWRNLAEWMPFGLKSGGEEG